MTAAMHLLNEMIAMVPTATGVQAFGLPAPISPIPPSPTDLVLVDVGGQYVYATARPPSAGLTSPERDPHEARMEIVWHGEFQRLFRQYAPDVWSLMPVFEPPEQVPGLRVFKDSAKVRFSCQECGHGWTSMKGRVVFWFTLVNHYGVVMFKLYGQQCMRCKNGKYEHAMWYPEEVVKVIGNVYNRIGQLHYGFVRPPLRIDRRQGKPRNQHNADLCQACKDGLCKEEWTFS